MSRRLIKALALILATGITGCATNSEKLLTHGGRSLEQIWRKETGRDPSQRQLLDARQALRRPLDKPGSNDAASSYTRTAQNEIYRQLQRLPNPDLVMYVFPHLAGSTSLRPVVKRGWSSAWGNSKVGRVSGARWCGFICTRKATAGVWLPIPRIPVRHQACNAAWRANRWPKPWKRKSGSHAERIERHTDPASDRQSHPAHLDPARPHRT